MEAKVLAPESAGLADYFTRPGLARRLKKNANELSAVVEVVFGETRVLLGGDLPEVRSGGVEVPTGWRAVCRSWGSQAAHSALKVPHHGSKEALAPCLVKSAGIRRPWVVAPFNSSPRLPSFEPEEGVDEMLSHEPEFHLTGMPRAFKTQTPLGVRTARSAVSSAGQPLKLPGGFGDGVPVGNPVSVSPSDFIWALVFDDKGRLVERYRGEGATVVHR